VLAYCDGDILDMLENLDEFFSYTDSRKHIKKDPYDPKLADNGDT
jgi:hypothetical protein